MNPEQIKIIIADETPLMRQGIRQVAALFFPQATCIELSDEVQLNSIFNQFKPHVLVIDVAQQSFAKTNLAALKQQSPDTKIIGLSFEESFDFLRNKLNFLLDAFLFKNCQPAEIADAIKMVLNGEHLYCKRATEILFRNEMNETAETCPASMLSGREVEIVKLMGQSCTSKEIACKLCLSKYTVDTHRKNILQKLNVKSSNEVIKIAVEQGLLN